MHPPVHPASVARRAAPDAPADANNENAFLLSLGERVRELRATRGMTRRGLAQASGVSERYLALLETGNGNISVLLLLRIANALELPLADMCRSTPPQSADLKLITSVLQQLPARRLAGIRADLMSKFGKARAKKSRRIALIGLRGAGKSTLGEKLAHTLEMPFVELDREIEREAGTSLSEIFLLYGQEGYRRLEKRCLERVIAQHERVVIATGGSIVSEPETFQLLLGTCTTVWLKALPEEHMARVMAQGDTRPMAGNREAMQDLVRILEGRTALYGQADITLDTSTKTVEKSLRELGAAITQQLEEHAA
jgi:XRE family aerobic/anaerobic benzoate catabolism transcriptional regulator